MGRSTCRIAELGIVDRELQQSFRGRHDGVITLDTAEVAAVQPVTLAALAAWLQTAPADFTPWFLSEIDSLELLSWDWRLD
jgi:isopentenyldiphosphate isomerase